MKKTAVSLLLVLFCCVLLLPLGVRADEKEYTMDDAVFDIQIKNDGSAQVTETWTVSFKQGTFSRFKKEIHSLNLKTDEYFSEPENIRVFIDDRECTYTDEYSRRPDNTFYLSRGEEGVTVECYRSSSNVTRKYVISYTLPKIVKCVNADKGPYYLLVYTCLGAKWQGRVARLTVNITAPRSCDMRLLYKSSGSETVSSDSIRISDTKVSGKYKIRVRMDGINIPGAISIQESDLHSELSETQETIFVFLGRIFCIALVVYLIYLSGIIRRISIRKKVRRDPGCVADRLEAWKRFGTPLEIGALFDRSVLLPAAILESIHSGAVQYDRNTGTLSYPAQPFLDGTVSDATKETLTGTQMVLYILEKCRIAVAEVNGEFEDTDGTVRSISLKDFICQISGEKSVFCRSATEDLCRILGQAGKRRIEHDFGAEAAKKGKKFLKREQEFFRTALPILCPEPPTEEKVLQSDFDYMTVLEYMLVRKDDKNNETPEDDIGKLAYLACRACRSVLPSYTSDGLPTNSSGCSSCSSCGGCSSCAGAD